MDIIETIKEQIAKNTVLLYMKGSPNAPQCGFSSKAAQVVMACGEKKKKKNKKKKKKKKTNKQTNYEKQNRHQLDATSMGSLHLLHYHTTIY